MVQRCFGPRRTPAGCRAHHALGCWLGRRPYRPLPLAATHPSLNCNTQRAADLLESLHKMFETLETIGKSLEDYLETKRIAFPRWRDLADIAQLVCTRPAVVERVDLLLQLAPAAYGCCLETQLQEKTPNTPQVLLPFKRRAPGDPGASQKCSGARGLNLNWPQQRLHPDCWWMHAANELNRQPCCGRLHACAMPVPPTPAGRPAAHWQVLRRHTAAGLWGGPQERRGVRHCQR